MEAMNNLVNKMKIIIIAIVWVMEKIWYDFFKVESQIKNQGTFKKLIKTNEQFKKSARVIQIIF